MDGLDGLVRDMLD